MANITILNIYEGVAQTVASGGEVSFGIRSGGIRTFGIYTDETVALEDAQRIWTFDADTDLQFRFTPTFWPKETGSPGVYNPAVLVKLEFTINRAGTYYVTAYSAIGEAGLVYFRMKLTVTASDAPTGDSPLFPTTALDWLDGTFCDLRFELKTRDVVSYYLEKVKTIKPGDDMKFAVVVLLDGVEVDDDVAALRLSIRAPDLFGDAEFLFGKVSGVTKITGGGHTYYKLEMEIGGGQLLDFFDEMNGGALTGDQLRRINAMAELCIDYDGQVITSKTFTMVLEQPVGE